MAVLLALVFASFFAVISLCSVGSASALTTLAQQAIVVDLNTDTVLYEKNADLQMTPSSLTKVLTAYVVINEIKAGRVSLNDRYRVSKAAFRRGGSSMFLLENERATVLDLLRGLIVVSGNDAAITLATGVSGSEDEFASLMNATAKAIGMQNSNFVNASGWPEDRHYSTARDMAILSMRLISDHPDFYSLFSEIELTHNKVKQNNRNPLLYQDFDEFPEGFLLADGIKTGTTKAGGHGLIGSAVDSSGRRIVMVLNGFASKNHRRDESADMMRWAFSEFQTYELFQAGQIVGYAPVWFGQKDLVALHVTKSIRTTLPPTTFANMQATLVYNAPLEAPIYIDQQVGHVQLAGPGMDPILVPVVTGESIDSVGRVQQVLSGLHYSVFGLEN